SRSTSTSSSAASPSSPSAAQVVVGPVVRRGNAFAVLRCRPNRMNGRAYRGNGHRDTASTMPGRDPTGVGRAGRAVIDVAIDLVAYRCTASDHGSAQRTDGGSLDAASRVGERHRHRRVLHPTDGTGSDVRERALLDLLR